MNIIIILFISLIINFIIIIDYRNTPMCALQISQLICTVSGGLVNSYTWTITDRSTVTSQLVLSSFNFPNLFGIYRCNISDSYGRKLIALFDING